MRTAINTTETIKLLLKANDYFMARAEFPTTESETTCLVWTGPMRKVKSRNDTRPQMKVKDKWLYVARFVWAVLYEPLPDTARLRNVCGNVRCVNPDHYTRTDRFCKFGHALTGGNLHIQKVKDPITGNTYFGERCRQCQREYNYKYRGTAETNTPRPHLWKTGD